MGSDDIEKKIGLMLRVLRGEISQNDMADKVGTTQPQVSRYENHENVPDLQRLQQYANELGYQVVIGLQSSPKEGFEVRWPIPENLPEGYEEAVEILRKIPPSERGEIFESIHHALTEGKRIDVGSYEESQYAQKLYGQVNELLDRLIDIEDKDGVSDVMKAKRKLE